MGSLPREPVERAPGALKVRKFLFFGAKSGRVRHKTAARASRGMLHVQHLMKKHVFDGKARHAGTVHPPIQQNVIRPRIIAAELAAPGTMTPSNARPLQRSREIPGIQFVKHFVQIKMTALRTGCAWPHTPTPQAIDPRASAMRASVLEISGSQLRWGFTAIDTGQQERRRAFDHRPRSAAQQIRQAHQNEFFAAANGQDQAAVRIKLDAKARRPALTAEAREHPLKKSRGPGDKRSIFRRSHSF